MAKEDQVYVLSDAERQIFHLSRLDGGDARYFTDYFLNGWLFDHNIEPPWQLEMHHASQMEVTIIGGFGSGKTVAMAVSYLIRASTIPYYRFLNVAPTQFQSKQMFEPLLLILENTPLKEKFIDMGGKIIERPYPMIVLKNDYIGHSTMEFMSADKQGTKILAWEGDAAHIDEAGLLEDLEDTTRNLGTRLRGVVRHRELFDPTKLVERAREGRLSMTSNAWENPYMWWRAEQGDLLSGDYWSRVISTYSNKNLTPRQIKGFERRVTTEEDRQRWFEGKRPTGMGDQFSRDMIDLCEDEGLNAIMDASLQKSLRGYHKESAEKCGVILWEMPPDKDRLYCILGDPGQGNPPGRNAPCIGVWDYTSFPNEPAVLRAFWWGIANGSYEPFVNTMYRYAQAYNSTDIAFDATGSQKMMDELVFERDGLLAQGLNMTGLKHTYNTALKLFMGKGLMRFPYIPGIRGQLGNYVLPDGKIAQDIVAMFQLTAGYLRNFYYVAHPEEKDEIDPGEIDDEHRRYARDQGDRYARHSTRPTR